MAPGAEAMSISYFEILLRWQCELSGERQAMTRLNLILLVLLVACSLAVVTAQHRARKVFMELAQEQDTAAALDVEFDRLRLEQRTWAMHSRIEKVARQNLGMQAPQADRTRVLSLDGVTLQP